MNTVPQTRVAPSHVPDTTPPSEPYGKAHASGPSTVLNFRHAPEPERPLPRRRLNRTAPARAGHIVVSFRQRQARSAASQFYDDIRLVRVVAGSGISESRKTEDTVLVPDTVITVIVRPEGRLRCSLFMRSANGVHRPEGARSRSLPVFSHARVFLAFRSAGHHVGDVGDGVRCDRLPERSGWRSQWTATWPDRRATFVWVFG